jgi:hypothetical protein
MKTIISVDHEDPSALASWFRAAAHWVEANSAAMGNLATKPVALVDSAKTRGEMRAASEK